MTSKIHREQLLLSLLGALGLSQMGCGEKYSHEICRALPADRQCQSKSDLWRELRWNRSDCASKLLSIDSEAMIKFPNPNPHYPSGSVATHFPGTTGVTSCTSSTTSTQANWSSSASSGQSTGSHGSSGDCTNTAGTSSTSTGVVQPPQKLACCYKATSRYRRWDWCGQTDGRPLLQSSTGEPVLANLSPGEGWTSKLEDLALPDLEALGPAQREAMAKEWAKIATQEHASIAAFAQLALELLRYGAPAELIETCQGCMQDEIRHAKLAFRWASHLAGQELAPEPMERLAHFPMSQDLTGLALSNLQEGCCNETLATLRMLDRADRCSHPNMKALIRTIALDEQRHAQFAWRLTQWFLAKEPRLWPVLDARMQELLAVSKEPELPSDDELGKTQLLAPLWQAMKAQTPSYA